MSEARKSILVVGLGRFFLPSSPNAAVGGSGKVVAADMEKASQHGFDCKSVDLNPNDPTAALNQVKEILQSKKWDGFNIGYGVRGNRDFTPLFESLVNLSREVSPQTKLMFSTAPDAVYEAIQRAFPEAK